MHEVKGDGVGQVLDLAAEAVGEAGKVGRYTF
jgi:hypothetical protein